MTSADFNIWTSVLVPLIVALFAGGSVQWLLVRRPLKVKEEFEDRARLKNAAAARQERAEQAHARAAEVHADAVAEVYYLLDAIAADVLGPEADFFSIEHRAQVDPKENAALVLDRLRTIWTSHPTAQVRTSAKNLFDSIDSFYGELLPGDVQRPTTADGEVLLDHRRHAERLVELLHQPPEPTA